MKPGFEHPADGWYQIEPKGEHPNRAAGVVQVIDDRAIQAIVNRFNTDADAGKLSHGTEMLVDHEHFKHDTDKETVAYGWLQQLQARADGVYGKIRWTGTGKAAVDSGDYRFFSTEYDPADVTLLNAEGKFRKVRPTRLDGLTLTNEPNNRGGKPITNRATPTANRQSEAARARADEEWAARRIGRLAVEEQQAAGGSLAGCYLRVTNREGVDVFGRASAKAASSGRLLNRQLAASLVQWSCHRLLAEAEKTGLAGHAASLLYVQNRLPALAKIANVAGTTTEELDVINNIIAGLEPKARKAFEQGFNAAPEDRNPKDFWGDILALVNVPALKAENPDLDDTDADAVLNELKARDPQRFYQVVLRFDGPGDLWLWDADQESRRYAVMAGGGVGIFRREMAARREKKR